MFMIFQEKVFDGDSNMNNPGFIRAVNGAAA
jgi:hypothetical protein